MFSPTVHTYDRPDEFGSEIVTESGTIGADGIDHPTHSHDTY